MAGVLLAVCLAALSTVGAWAAGIVVNSAGDTVADDGECTLREAIVAANTDTASGATVGECAAGSRADTITFAGNYTITLAGSQLPSISSEITINGNGEANTILQASTCDPISLPGGCTPVDHRVLQVDASGSLTLENASIRHGRAPGGGACDPLKCQGGGIYNQGTLTLTEVTLSSNEGLLGGGLANAGTAILERVTISDNGASNGGGVYNKGTLTISDSSLSDNARSAFHNEAGDATLTRVDISDNSSDSDGGGIYVLDGSLSLTDVILSGNTADSSGGGITSFGSSLNLERVTLSGNTANGGGTDGGGGLYLGNGDPVSLTNVTFSGNSAPNGYGGGMMILVDEDISLTNVTFSGNSAVAGQGGGLFNVSGHPRLTNVLLTGNSNGGDCVIFTGADTLDPASSNNLIEDAANACGLTNGTDGNIIGTDPMLEALADNGGFTQTMALPAGSAAMTPAPTWAARPRTSARRPARRMATATAPLPAILVPLNTACSPGA